MFGLVPFKFNNGENSRGLTINDMSTISLMMICYQNLILVEASKLI